MAKLISEDNVYSMVEQSLHAAKNGNFILAEQLLLRTYSALESGMSHNKEMRALVFHLLANNYRDRKKLKLARDYYEMASDLANSKFSLALCEDLYIQALCEQDLQLALRVQTELGQSLQAAVSAPLKYRLLNLKRLAALHWSLSDYSEAEKNLRSFLQLAQKENAISTSEYIKFLTLLGLICFRLEKFEEAECLYREALTNSQKHENLSEFEQAEIRSQLGFLLCKQERHAEAKSLCDSAAQLRNYNVENTSSQLRTVANVYCSDCFDRAMKYCHAAIDVFEKGCADPSHHANADLLVVIFQHLGLVEDALKLENAGKRSNVA